MLLLGAHRRITLSGAMSFSRGYRCCVILYWTVAARARGHWACLAQMRPQRPSCPLGPITALPRILSLTIPKYSRSGRTKPHDNTLPLHWPVFTSSRVKVCSLRPKLYRSQAQASLPPCASFVINHDRSFPKPSDAPQDPTQQDRNHPSRS